MTGQIARTPHPRRKFSLLAAALISLTTPALLAQATASPPAAAPAPAAVVSPPAALSSTPAKPIEFNVVSIKQNKSASMNGGARSMPDGEIFVNTTLQIQIGPAYGVEPDDVYGLPDWAKTNHYDIQYKVAAEDIEAYRKLRWAGQQHMLQTVLEDRLKLKAHLGTKEVPMYQLVIAKGATKLHEAKPGDTYADGIKAPDGTPIGGAGAMMGRGFFTGQQVTVSGLLNSLKGATGRDVIDKTGLTGKYDITLHWATDPSPTSPDSAPPDDTGPSIFTALEELGLKLEPTKGTIPTLIIDHIEPPSPN